jgi:hypothetical protein
MGFAIHQVRSSSRSSLEDSVLESLVHIVQAGAAKKGLLMYPGVKS